MKPLVALEHFEHDSTETERFVYKNLASEAFDSVHLEEFLLDSPFLFLELFLADFPLFLERLHEKEILDLATHGHVDRSEPLLQSRDVVLALLGNAQPYFVVLCEDLKAGYFRAAVYAEAHPGFPAFCRRVSFSCRYAAPLAYLLLNGVYNLLT